MTTADLFVQGYQFYRQRTIALLDRIEKEPNPQAVLAWRPGPGRAHIGWQLMHIGVTEELFASQRLAQKPGAWTDLWPRFRGGSTPDDNVPSPQLIREVLSGGREHLLATLKDYGDERLGEIPEYFKERGLTVREILYIIGWHEAHHQGQAHITFNLYKAQTT
jgi:uncharacterized damage-inducible protein DinB